VFDHLDLLVIHLFKRKKTYLKIKRQNISVDRCVNIQKVDMRLENLEALRTLSCLLILRLMAIIAFHIFIKHTAVITRRILKYFQMSPRAVLHVEGMYFSDCKNETKN
jgi:hypothetical protein